MSPRGRNLLIGLVVLVLLVVGAGRLAHGYVDWLWFDSLGQIGVFWTSLKAAWVVGLSGGVLAGLFTLAGLWPAGRALSGLRPPVVLVQAGRPLWRPRPGRIFAGIAVLVGWLTGLILAGQWLTVLRALHAYPFGGEPDPLFGRDVGFYIFRLPLWQLIYQSLMALVVVTGLVVLAVYAVTGYLVVNERQFRVHPRARAHFSAFVAGFFLLKAWGYYLTALQLVYSPRGVAFGASYTDIHANLPALRILLVVALLVALVAMANTVRDLLLPLAGAVLTLMVASMLLGTVVPAVMQRFVVAPSETAMETPYIKNNITMTRRAYNLADITQQPYPATGELTAADVGMDNATIDNVRLWDWRVLGQTYQQLQGLRSYYQFDEMDVDRYNIGGQMRQVLLAPREINYGKLPQQTWINQHIKYTHGYGVTVSPAARVGPDGFPDFWVKDVPPVSEVPELRVDRPEIYFGEQTDPYAIVDTSEQEFDYPKGESNAYTRYTGRGGIPIGSFLNRLAFAMDTGDYNVLFTGAITGDSRALVYRNIKGRLQRLAPYLFYDADPYIVIAGGRQVWVQDAYTVTNLFPYSEPATGDINYIRNAVKVTIDAYDGSVNFYTADPADPLLRSYAAIYPQLYRPLDQMPAELRAHLRYPEQLFGIQGQMYAKYHMTDPQVFYNSEDLWQVAQEAGSGAPGPVAPYYSILQLPGSNAAEYLLLQPYTPLKRTNMVAWLGARSDAGHYGEMIAYLFPKERNVLGPQQVESNINSTPAISQSITLWNQQGSQVTRGVLFVFPIKNSLLYIQPLYLQGSTSPLPRLQRVIVSYGDQVAMAPNLEAALAEVFSGKGAPPAPGGPAAPGGAGGPGAPAPGTPGPGAPAPGTPGAGAPAPGTAESVATLVARANQLYQDAQTALRAGDFAGYGRAVGELGGVLQRLQELSGTKPTGPVPATSAGKSP